MTRCPFCSRIVSFDVAHHPRCPRATSQVPVEPPICKSCGKDASETQRLLQAAQQPSRSGLCAPCLEKEFGKWVDACISDPEAAKCRKEEADAKALVEPVAATRVAAERPNVLICPRCVESFRVKGIDEEVERVKR